MAPNGVSAGVMVELLLVLWFVMAFDGASNGVHVRAIDGVSNGVSDDVTESVGNGVSDGASVSVGVTDVC